jgi:NAD+ synthase
VQLQRITCSITNFIEREVKKRKRQGVVAGMSGGLDSSVVVSLAVKALGNHGVFGLILPDSKITPKSDILDAVRLAENLKIEYRVIEIETMKRATLRKLPKNRLAEGNLSSRFRMCILYYFAGIMDRLVIGTSDKSELMLGYYTKHGDGAADIFPIADLYKTEIKLLAGHLEIPSTIIEKKSSPRLWKGQTAETEIGLNYEVIDKILQHFDRDTINKSGISKRNINIIRRLVAANKHKQDISPICKLDGNESFSNSQLRGRKGR